MTTINTDKIYRGYTTKASLRPSKKLGFSGKLQLKHPPSKYKLNTITDAQLLCNHYPECSGFIYDKQKVYDTAAVLMKGKKKCFANQSLCKIGGDDILSSRGESYRLGQPHYKVDPVPDIDPTTACMSKNLTVDRNWDTWNKAAGHGATQGLHKNRLPRWGRCPQSCRSAASMGIPNVQKTNWGALKTYIQGECTKLCKSDPYCGGFAMPSKTNNWSSSCSCILYKVPNSNEDLSFSRQSGVNKATYDSANRKAGHHVDARHRELRKYKKFAVERVKNPVSLDLHNFNVYRDQVISEGFVSNTITLPDKANQYADVNTGGGTNMVTLEKLKSQRDRLESLRTSELTDAAEGFRMGLEDINKDVSKLKIMKDKLEIEEHAVDKIIPGKELRILKLEKELAELHEDALVEKSHLTRKIEELKTSITSLKNNIISSRTDILIKGSEIAKSIERLEELAIQYNSRLIESRSVGKHIMSVKEGNALIETNNKGLKAANELAPKILAIHKRKLDQLKNDLLSYMEQVEWDPMPITRLISRSQQLAINLFDEAEKKYNFNTARLNTRFIVSSPTDILYLNQNAEFNQNKQKLDNLKKDTTTIHKDIQIKHNEFRKRSYYIFILKIIFICTLFLLLIGLLMKNDNITKVTGWCLIGGIVFVLIVILLSNYIVNSNRNKVFFNKRDWANTISSSAKKSTCAATATGATGATNAIDTTNATNETNEIAGGRPGCTKLCAKPPADCAELDGYLAPGGCAEACSEIDKSTLREFMSCQNTQPLASSTLPDDAITKMPPIDTLDPLAGDAITEMPPLDTLDDIETEADAILMP